MAGRAGGARDGKKKNFPRMGIIPSGFDGGERSGEPAVARGSRVMGEKQYFPRKGTRGNPLEGKNPSRGQGEPPREVFPFSLTNFRRRREFVKERKNILAGSTGKRPLVD